MQQFSFNLHFFGVGGVNGEGINLVISELLTDSSRNLYSQVFNIYVQMCVKARGYSDNILY